MAAGRRAVLVLLVGRRRVLVKDTYIPNLYTHDRAVCYPVCSPHVLNSVSAHYLLVSMNPVFFHLEVNADEDMI